MPAITTAALKIPGWSIPFLVVACLAPVFSGYIVGFIWMWILCIGLATNKSFRSFFHSRAFRQVQPIYLAIAASTILHILAEVGSFSSHSVPNSRNFFNAMSHDLIKIFLVPTVFLTGFLIFSDRSAQHVRNGSRFIGILFLVHFAYLIAQRNLGIDWVRGFGSVLGPHRYAYGVYRLSGFMSHPLTLAYNLMLLTFLCLGIGLFAKTGKNYWFIGSGLVSAASIALSGSRWPFFCLSVGLVLWSIRAWRPRPKIILAGFFAAAAALVLEGSLWSRTLELVSALKSGDFNGHIPRLSFWQAHWKIFIENPLFGLGSSGLPFHRMAYFHSIGYNGPIDTAHNIFLQALAESGIIGLFRLGITFVGIAIGIRNLENKQFQLCGYTLLLLTVLAGLTQNVLWDSEYVLCFWVSIGVLFALDNIQKPNAVTSPGDHARHDPAAMLLRPSS